MSMRKELGAAHSWFWSADILLVSSAV
uniref:Uncharacterized protein n=1 Tax=Anguilla anguilla TaxID=7936 RepID=A0A0E9TNB3_ANGAN